MSQFEDKFNQVAFEAVKDQRGELFNLVRLAVDPDYDMSIGEFLDNLFGSELVNAANDHNINGDHGLLVQDFMRYGG